MILQIVSPFHSKWSLVHFIFISHVGTLQFPEFVGLDATVSNCPKEGTIESSVIDCELKQEIVATHNEFRQRIAAGNVPNQPPAKSMRELYWDDDLARRAQHWSEFCKFAHSDPLYRIDERCGSIGENIGQTKSKANLDQKDFKKHIQKWFNENERFTYGPVMIDNLLISGHYTQLASARTYMVGCGFSRYRIKNIYHRLYICHYGPSGNKINDSPYEAGEVDCQGDLQFSKTYPNLCTTINPSSRLNCSVPITSTVVHVESTTIPEYNSGRKFLDSISDNRDIINSECEPYKPDGNALHDDKIIKNIRVENMYNLIFLNA